MNNFWTFLVAGVTVLAGVAGILWWLDFKPNGPRMLAGLKARIQAPRKEREELQRQVTALWKALNDQLTFIQKSGELADRHLNMIDQLSKWVRDLQADVARLRTGSAPVEKRLDELEAENAQLREQDSEHDEELGNVVQLLLTLAKRVDAESLLPESYHIPGSEQVTKLDPEFRQRIKQIEDRAIARLIEAKRETGAGS